MKILIVTNEIGLDGGGLSLSCAKLRKMLAEDNIVEIANSRNSVFPIAKGGYSGSVSAGLEFESKLKMESYKYNGFDIVIGFGGNFNGYYASLLSERINASFILSLRGSDINLSKWSSEDNWYMVNACRKAKFIVCLSKEMKRNVLSSCDIKESKIYIIPNYMETLFQEIRTQNDPKSIRMGCASSFLNEKKGIANLLQMVAELKALTCSKVSFDFVGNVDTDLLKEYNTIVEKLGITDCVSFIGKMDRESLALQMKQWDYYVQGSVCEGHSNAVIEALSAGVAIATTPTGYVAEIAKDVFPEIVFNSFDSKDMAESINRLNNLGDKSTKYKELCNRLAENCNKEKVKFQWERLVSSTEPASTELPVKNVIAVTLHDISGQTHDNITTPTTVFSEFVEYIHQKGIGLCSMRDYVAKSNEEQRKWIVCTFDDGYNGVHEYAKQIMKRYHFTATIFVCTSLFGKYNTWNYKDSKARIHLNIDQIKDLANAGWEIASHGVSHHNLLKLNDLEIEHQLADSQKTLIDMVGYSDTYAYPYGASNTYIQNMVGKYYKYAFSLTEGGCILGVDNLHIRRYFISDIYRIFGK